MRLIRPNLNVINWVEEVPTARAIELEKALLEAEIRERLEEAEREANRLPNDIWADEGVEKLNKLYLDYTNDYLHYVPYDIMLKFFEERHGVIEIKEDIQLQKKLLRKLKEELRKALADENKEYHWMYRDMVNTLKVKDTSNTEDHLFTEAMKLLVHLVCFLANREDKVGVGHFLSFLKLISCPVFKAVVYTLTIP